MKFADHKTKIVCTIGPASKSLAVVEDMVKAGMNVARINCSHGDFLQHEENIRNVRKAAAKHARHISIIMDLPGVKMRIGRISKEPLMLQEGAKVILTSGRVVTPDERIIPVEYKNLSANVSKGSIIYLNDGFIQLKVDGVRGEDVMCRVTMGGPLLSHKGLNLPGAKLSVNAITRRDLQFVEFGLKHGVTVFGISFVAQAADIIKVRQFAAKKGKKVFLVAKIERQEAIENFDAIAKEADAVMIARGDLGVQIPIEEVPFIQKRLIHKANILGRPVITATQMLESMTHNVRPTRAEVNDVANAILDGTDAVMLSEETAMGAYPALTIEMMAKVAASTERQRSLGGLSNDESEQIRSLFKKGGLTITDVLTLNVVRAAEDLRARYIVTPTHSGSTARRISRFKPNCWTVAFTARLETCMALAFSYGVQPFLVDKPIRNNHPKILRILKKADLIAKGDTLVMTDRLLSDRPGETDSLGIVTLE
jgi:pyruvate kinase